MPFIIRTRADIPDGFLQFTDLRPNSSQRNLIYDPPGQSGYASYGGITTTIDYNDIPVLFTDGGGVVTVVREGNPLSGWFLTNVAANGAAFSAVLAMLGPSLVANMVGIIGGSPATDITAAFMGFAGLVTAITSDQVTEILRVLAGEQYVVPAGTQVEAAGVFSVVPAVGSTGGPGFVAGTRREIYDTGSLRISFGSGVLSRLASADFTYGGVTGAAVAVYNDDGTLFSV